jgi:hypothetical protein
MHNSLNQSQQRGTALLISMIILLVMSMIIVQGARTANLELLVGNNTQFAAEALMLAEDGAVAGEGFLNFNYSGAPVTNYGENDDDGVYLAGQVAVISVDWDSLSPEYYGRDGTTLEYIVEYLGPSSATGGSVSVGAGVASDTRYVYRISGRGESGRGGARVIQTIFATAE